ncbi:MAG: leucine-rich repeat protein [Sphaerochaetaceae bacterium]|nr:leucine-rich repeat protein [Sphaerochaetaceae bacterium]
MKKALKVASIILLACFLTGSLFVSCKTEIEYETLTFNSNGGSAVTTQQIEKGKTATEPKAPTRPGYEFDDWYIDSEFNNSFEFTKDINENTILYAKWNTAPFKLTFSSADGTENLPADQTINYDIIKTATEPETDPTRLGYEFKGWYTDSEFNTSFNFATPITEDITVYAKWKATPFKLTFSSADGTENLPADQTINYDIIKTATEPETDPTRLGYEFDDWYTDSEFNTSFDFATPVTEDTTVYAKWIAKNVDSATYGDYTYSVTNSKATITKYNGGDTSITIPSKIGGFNVTTIGERAFYNCANIISVTIPDSVTTIGDKAFYYCSELTSINIPNSVTSIGNYAFYRCVKLTSSIIIPEGVTTISDHAFYYCSELTSINIPDSVTSIGNSAFSNCSGLNSINIPDLVTSIGNMAFYNCTGLTEVTKGNSVTSIGDKTFSHCSELTSINIPDSVTSIGNSAFYYCSKLTSITIPNSVITIGDKAFYNCSELTSITIPDSVTSIGEKAFYYFSKITSITIPNSVTSIGSKAFYNSGMGVTTNINCYCTEENKPDGWVDGWYSDHVEVTWSYTDPE